HYLLSNSFQMGELLNYSLTAGLESRVPEEEHMLVRLALREMMINAIEHGNLGITFAEKTAATQNNTLADLIQERLQNPHYATRKLHVKIDSDESRVQFTLRDEGEGFDHRAMVERARSANETDALYHGRGLRFALSFFNSVEYNERGNEVRLTRIFK
ncbi:MAG: ATP-binding protein, partial [Spirochaetia bacterium]|nr:ATP-binding protein [Spirochaetia bacterium]